jgi:transposase InsO family protein
VGSGFNEGTGGKLMAKLVNREIFYSLLESQVLVEQWRREYNRIRPHDSLGYRPPAAQAVRPRESWLRRPVLQGPGLAARLTWLVVSLLGARREHC